MIKRLLFACLASLILLAICVYFSEKPGLLSDVPFGRLALAENGEILRICLSDDQKYRLYAPLDAISPEAVKAVLHYEDKGFYEHPGIDILAVGRALAGVLTGSRRSGASTITMQVARLRYGLKTSSITGKLKQMWMALILERHYTKAEILEAYFNLAPYGGNIEGLEAASRIYFHKPAASLTQAEARSLASVPQNPIARHPFYGRAFNEARLRLEKSMGNSSTLPALAVQSPVKVPFKSPHLVNFCLRNSDAAIIRTTIQPDLQEAVENGITQFLERHERFGLRNAAAMLVDSKSMEVQALVGSASFFDPAISGQIDGTLARRSPGSTLKPFIYALALQQGLIHPQTILADTPRSFGGYDPENFDRKFQGPVSARDALQASRNLPAIILAEQLANPGLPGFLQSAQVRLQKPPDYYGLALVLGGAEITMRELASLYVMLLNQGQWQPLRFEKNASLQAGRMVLTPEASSICLWMLENGAITSFGKILPLRFKTGTSNGLRDAWCAGILGEYVLIVWLGNFDNTSSPLLVGAKSALPLFMEIGAKVAGMRKLGDMQAAIRQNLNLAWADVCKSTGDFDTGHCGEKIRTLYIPGVSPVTNTGILRPVLLDRSSGMRACQAGENTIEAWYEFWPTDMLEIFAQAGIHKPPLPAWLPECQPEKRETPGRGPKITLPKKNVVYKRPAPAKDWKLPLKAACEADAEFVHWYAGKRYLGKSRPAEVFLWQPETEGYLEITAIDDKGRSGRQKCHIETGP